jgi:dihydrofolate synthase/folylpolyglutamate synthase
MSRKKQMNYTETIDYLQAHLPMFHREGKSAYKANLDNIYALSSAFNFPEKRFKSIHVAGTNGKGSVCHILASVLQHAGYKTGLFTSPHLLDFRERIKVNGIMATEGYIVSFVEKHKKLLEDIQPSFFEMTTIMAFDYFAREQVDIAVIETGLGGRLDATNIITPLVSVITNISFDHVDILGNSLEEIAGEKAGIIKPGIPVVIGEKNLQVFNIFKQKASEMQSKIIFADDYFKTISATKLNFNEQQITVENKNISKTYSLDLLGQYQSKNLLTVLASIGEIKNSGISIPDEALTYGLANVSKITGLHGRWQILGRGPLIISDTGHNEAGIQSVFQQLNQYKFNKLHVIFGMVKEKDIHKILSYLPDTAIYYFTKASIPRALDENVLREGASKFGLKGEAYPMVKEAIKFARLNASKHDCIFIGGSTFVVGEALGEF